MWVLVRLLVRGLRDHHPSQLLLLPAAPPPVLSLLQTPNMVIGVQLLASNPKALYPLEGMVGTLTIWAALQSSQERTPGLQPD